MTELRYPDLYKTMLAIASSALHFEREEGASAMTFSCAVGEQHKAQLVFHLTQFLMAFGMLH
jgi:hypothetical protein